MTDKKKWYVVTVYTGQENKVKAALQERIRQNKLETIVGEIFVPVESTTEFLSSGKQRTKTKSTFPGYIFIEAEMTDQLWHIIKATPKINRFIGDNTPTEISLSEIGRLREGIVKGTVKPRANHKFQVGDNVKVITGAFLNFAGPIEEINADKQKLKVIVSIFGRDTPVELEYNQVEKTQ